MTLTNTRGIFALFDVRVRQNTRYWGTPGFNYGYFGGGPPSSIVDRIDYSNDTSTASVRGPLSVSRSEPGATGNSSYGYFGGGYTPNASSQVDRIDYSNDTATASPKGPLSLARAYVRATGNSSYGWFGGGTSGGGVGGTPYSTVDRIDYSNDTATASPRGPLTLARAALSATGNSSYGWFAGGLILPSAVSQSTVDRIDYSNDTATASPRGPLSVAKSYSAATGNSSYGWFGGGFISSVDRIDYSNDTATASPRGPLSLARGYVAATGNSSFGYFGGGSGPLSSVDRIDYSNDTATASVRGPLSAARGGLAASSAAANGLPQILPNTPEQKKLAVSYGYFGGGSGPLSSVDRIDYSNDTATASVRGPLSAARYNLAATGNSFYGWFGGGGPAPADVSRVDRIDYSNDTATASVRGPLSLARNSVTATGNSSYGWFGGGFIPDPLTNYSLVDRIDYSNDTATTSTRGPLSLARRNFAATGNSSYGWFGGGFAPGNVSIVDRIDYSNDTATASTRGPLSGDRRGSGATGNSSYGWFGGGFAPSTPEQTSTVGRIDYSNDTVTASPRGPLSLARGNLSATGNNSFGWFGGGTNITPATVSAVDRIDYSNDTATASPRGPLSLARIRMGATSAAANGLPQ
jgi:hypothetical protein